MERMPTLADARRQLLKVTEDLEALRFRLMGIQGTLPEPAAEKLADVEELDAAAEVRAVIDCVLRDWMGPAIRDLQDVLVGTRETVDEGAGE